MSVSAGFSIEGLRKRPVRHRLLRARPAETGEVSAGFSMEELRPARPQHWGAYSRAVETGARGGGAALLCLIDGAPFRRWGCGLRRKSPCWSPPRLGQVRPSLPLYFLSA